MGVSGKRKFGKQTQISNSKTCYGISIATSSFYLNGKWHEGDHGEKIRYPLIMDHFREGNLEIDIYLDADIGLLKIKRVDYNVSTKTEKQIEAQIEFINNGRKYNDGWVPLFSFAYYTSRQGIKIARIDPSLYGQKMKIEW